MVTMADMLHYTETGTGDPVVLLHAFPIDSTLWATQRTDLAAHGLRVITPDLPGFGGSTPSAAAPALDVMADEVAGLLDHLGLERAIVGGLSMGGYVTMALLRRHPDRLAAIILADTKASADPPAAVATRLSVAEAVEASGSTSALAEAMLPNLLGQTTRSHSEEVVDMVRRWIAAQPPAGVAWAQRAMADRPDSTSDIAGFGRPVLVLHGEEDTISPTHDALAIAEAARSGGSPTTVVEIPAAGHLSAVETRKRSLAPCSAGWPQCCGSSHSGLVNAADRYRNAPAAPGRLRAPLVPLGRPQIPRNLLIASRCLARLASSRTPRPSSGARHSTPTLPWWRLRCTSWAACPVSLQRVVCDSVG